MGKSSLKFRLPFYIGLVVIVPVIILASYAYVQINRMVVQQKVGDMMNVIDTKYIHLLELLDRQKADTNQLAKMSEISNDLEKYNSTNNPAALAPVTSLLNNYVRELRLRGKHAFDKEVPTRDRYDEIMVMNNEGIIVASTRDESIGKDMSQTGFYAADKMSFIDAYRDYTGRVVYGYAAPVVKDGRVVGILAVKSDTRLLQMLMTGELGNITGGALWFAGFSPSLDFYIMNKDGQMITQSRTIKSDTVLTQKGSDEPLRL